MTSKDILDSILPIILELAHDSEEEESRSLAVSLMAHFASKIDQEYVEKIFVSELISLSDDLVN